MPMLANLKPLDPDPETELVVVWDGRHGNQDWDLLRGDLRIPEKFAPPRGERIRASDLIERAFRLAGTPQTIRGLMAATDVSVQTVTSVLYLLRQQGRLASRDMVGTHAHGSRGRGVREYWLTGPVV